MFSVSSPTSQTTHGKRNKLGKHINKLKRCECENNIIGPRKAKIRWHNQDMKGLRLPRSTDMKQIYFPWCLIKGKRISEIRRLNCHCAAKDSKTYLYLPYFSMEA